MENSPKELLLMNIALDSQENCPGQADFIKSS